ncbi:MAG: beta-Ala-His dipeptidase [Fusobacteriaceae bacterium]|nr:beta-Ala-His dipeptidase [Fusobacteriaceae bacterium]
MKEKLFNNLDELLTNEIFNNFNKISQIPRPSFKEKKVSDFLKSWAESLDLEVLQDEYSNLLISKPASKGYEGKRPIILQAHTDMVCEKHPEVDHDFDKDPIDLVLDGDILSTGGRTTLGADNGIGVAIAMTILESNSLSHPKLDVLLTVAEEEDMSGALNVEPSWFRTNRIINLDNSIDNQLITGSAGGKGVKLSVPVKHTNVDKNKYKSFDLTVKDLQGGHSGEDIDKGLANSNTLLARLLNEIRKECELLISQIQGGNFRLAIPRESTCKINIRQNDLGKVQNIIDKLSKEFVNRYEGIEANLTVELKESDFNEASLDLASTSKAIDTILISPNGISEMLGGIDVVESSINLGEVYLKDNKLFFIYEIRAIYETSREYIYDKLCIISKLMNGDIEYFAKYPSWTYLPESDLRELILEIYEKKYGEVMEAIVLHAGLECGCFASKIKDMDAVSLGPNTWNLHAPSESVSVSSTIKIYNLLVNILKELN